VVFCCDLDAVLALDLARCADERAGLERRRVELRVELRLVEAELRSDEALRLQAEARDRAQADRGRLGGRWQDWVR
jgi:hypothetical protein